MQCPICISDIPSKAHASFSCQSCDYRVCADCQKTYDKPTCMSCSNLCSRSHFLTSLGLKATKAIFDPFVLRDLYLREQSLLPLYQAYVKWEKTCRQLRERRRFGDTTPEPPMPPVPKLNLATGFHCSNRDCRGYVHGGVCGICNVTHCVICQEAVHNHITHVCNPDTVQSILKIQQDSKPCPRCKTMINRSFGCDHMQCTACQTHFNWVTGEILRASTNVYYRRPEQQVRIQLPELPAALQGQPQAQPEAQAQVGYDACDLEDRDIVPESALPTSMQTPETVQLLYRDRAYAAFFKKSFYREEMIVERYETELQKIRIKYLLTEFTEEQWKAKIKQAYYTFQRSLAIAMALHSHLSVINSLQHAFYHGQIPTPAELVVQVQNLNQMTRDALAIVKANYGGTTPQIRETVEPTTEPVISR